MSHKNLAMTGCIRNEVHGQRSVWFDHETGEIAAEASKRKTSGTRYLDTDCTEQTHTSILLNFLSPCNP